jgi:hypothetical protein
MGHQEWISQQVDQDFQRARLWALLRGAVSALRQEPRTLLPFEEVRSRLNVRGQHDRGIQTVPLAQIVGSEGRYADFDRLFMPRHEATKERWKNIGRAHYNDVILPPVELYKLGGVYFVRDGNHRVSVARQQGQTDIDAYVIELVSDVPLRADMTANDLATLEERSDFLEWTNLAALRPGQDIEVSQPGGYLDMIRHINGHRYFKSLELGYELTSEEAVLSWYDTIYQPLIEAIERTGVLAAFPERTPADLYLWIMDHRHYLTQQAGVDPGAEQATLDYTRQFGDRRISRHLAPPPGPEEQEFLRRRPAPRSRSSWPGRGWPGCGPPAASRSATRPITGGCASTSSITIIIWARTWTARWSSKRRCKAGTTASTSRWPRRSTASTPWTPFPNPPPPICICW